MSDTIFVVNGPNLNLLGSREPDIYGRDTLDDIGAMLTAQGERLGLTVDMRQSNHEGQLIDWLHEAQAVGAKAVILNPGGFTHTSVALRDAVASITVPGSRCICRTPRRARTFVTRVSSARCARVRSAALGR